MKKPDKHENNHPVLSPVMMESSRNMGIQKKSQFTGAQVALHAPRSRLNARSTGIGQLEPTQFRFGSE